MFRGASSKFRVRCARSACVRTKDVPHSTQSPTVLILLQEWHRIGRITGPDLPLATHQVSDGLVAVPVPEVGITIGRACWHLNSTIT